LHGRLGSFAISVSRIPMPFLIEFITASRFPCGAAGASGRSRPGARRGGRAVVSDHRRAVGARDLPDQRGDLGRSRGRLRPGKPLLRGERHHIPGSRRRLGTLAALATPGDSGVPPTRLRSGGRTVQGEPRALPGLRGVVVDLLVPRRAGGGRALARRVPASRGCGARGRPCAERSGPACAPCTAPTTTATWRPRGPAWAKERSPRPGRRERR
jgi:hypothetical protein